MHRKLTPQSSLENLKREAKRWLKSLREGDADARARLERITPSVRLEPTLRDVQHALAREYGYEGWTALAQAVEQLAGLSTREGAIESLLAAAERGDAVRIGAILDAHPDIVNERGVLAGHHGTRTALHFAINSMREDVVDVLLARGADPNMRDDGDNAMPLHFAAERGNLAIVRKLVEHGADPIGEGTTHELDVLGWATCFSYAFHKDVADYLLAHGARHSIFSAVAMGDVDAVRNAAVKNPADLDRAMDRTNQRRRPLHLAVIKKQPRSLATLLELGAKPDVRDASDLTPLDQAALDGETEMTRLLLERGARVELPAAIVLGRLDWIDDATDRLRRAEPDQVGPTGRWRSLLLLAAERAPGSVIERLIRFGCDVNARVDATDVVDQVPGATPLHIAAYAGNREAVRVLLAHGANVRARDAKYHATPAGWADYAGHTAVRDLILDRSTDIFDAVQFDRPERFASLFDAHVSLNQHIGPALSRQPDANEWIKPWWTPLAFAIELDKPAAVRELLRLGARATVRAGDGPVIDLRGLAESKGLRDIVGMFDEQSAIAAADYSDDDASPKRRLARFLANACPDHHVRGGWSHRVARATAMRLLEQHPEIAKENIYTAVVCGEIDLVRELLRERPELARQSGGPKGSFGGVGQRFVVEPLKPSLPLWDPLLYLCFTRLPLARVNDNAVAIATLLLDHGANPNSYFMAGDSRYSPLTGVIGEGEESRKPHPRRDELTKLLLTRGANPYDVQVFYNVHFNGRVLWYLQLIYEHTLKTGRAADWEDPQWSMIDMGGYGLGARYCLDIAVDHDDVELAMWILEHGADPNATYPAGGRFQRKSLYEEAVARGHLAVADVLAGFGARAGGRPFDAEERFVAAAVRHDQAELRQLVATHPTLLSSTRAIFDAARRNDAAAVALLLDVGISPDVSDDTDQRPLHIAAYNNAVDVARLLIERGAAIDPVEKSWGNTPIDGAIWSDHQEMIELLATRSRNVWSLVFSGEVDRLRMLLHEKPALAKASHDGTTLLMYLPGDETLAEPMANLLLDHGADPTSRNAEGRTAAELAEQRGLSRVATLLQSRTEDPG